jgi:hypothetical protein
MASNVVTPVQSLGSLTDNSSTPQTTTGHIVKTGIYRLINADSHSNHFSWGGNPDVTSDPLVIHTAVNGAELFKLSKPKRANIIAATAASPCVLTVGGGGTPAHNFVVGDYVTITGGDTAAYNVSHVEVTAVTDTTITVTSDQSSSAAFAGTATASNSIKIQARGDTSNGLTLYIDEVQVSG